MPVLELDLADAAVLVEQVLQVLLAHVGRKVPHVDAPVALAAALVRPARHPHCRTPRARRSPRRRAAASAGVPLQRTRGLGGYQSHCIQLCGRGQVTGSLVSFCLCRAAYLTGVCELFTELVQGPRFPSPGPVRPRGASELMRVVPKGTPWGSHSACGASEGECRAPAADRPRCA